MSHRCEFQRGRWWMPEEPELHDERIDAENAVVAMAERAVRSSVVRLAPTVHSNLDRRGFIPRLLAMAREHGVSPHAGDGSNRWPAVHTLDAVHLYRLALESAPAGSRLHAAADQGVPFRDIAEIFGRHLGLPVVSVSSEQVPAHFPGSSRFVSVDILASSALTQQLVGWRPVHPGLIADLEQGHYFQSWLAHNERSPCDGDGRHNPRCAVR